MKYIIYSDDEREFIGEVTDTSWVRNIINAKKFESLEKAKAYMRDHFPQESYTLLQLVD